MKYSWPLIILLLLLLPSCAHLKIDSWDRIELGEAAILTALMVIDYGQTSKISRNPDQFHELNPVLGEHPNQGAVNTYFPIAWAFKLAVAHFLPHDWRKVWLAVWIGESAMCVGHNANRGLGP